MATGKMSDETFGELLESANEALAHAREAAASDTDDRGAALLPCPFCGGEAIVVQYMDDKRFRVRCTAPCGVGFDRWSEADAIAAWNHRRAPNSPNESCLPTMALHGQPFGFTWEDVDAMEAVYRRVISDLRPDSPSDAIERFYDLAARIAALLPPRETEHGR